MTRPFLHAVLLPVLLLPAPPAARAQEPPETKGEPEMTAAKSSGLQGRVRLTRRRGIPGVSVIVTPAGGGSAVWLTSTDDRGQFKLNDVPDGTYDLRLERDGYGPIRKGNVEVRYPFRAVVETTMQPAGAGPASTADGAQPASIGSPRELTVEGRVIGADGEPIGEVEVRALHVEARHDPRTVLTGEAGGFMLEGLAAGTWSLQIRGLGYLTIRGELTLFEDTVARVRLIEQPPDYEPSPLDLLPLEIPLPPPDPAG